MINKKFKGGIVTEVNRDYIRSVLKDAGLKTSNTESDDYPAHVFAFYEAVANQMSLDDASDFVMLVTRKTTLRPYQYTIVPETDERYGGLSSMIFLDQPEYKRHINTACMNWKMIEEAAEDMLYRVHEVIMKFVLPIFDPNDHRDVFKGGPIYSFSPGDLYDLRIKTYNESIPQAHLPPMMRDTMAYLN